jgi:hypothetical protein
LVDLDSEGAAAAAAKLDEDRALGLAADATDRGAMQRAVATTVDRCGKRGRRDGVRFQ